MYAGLGMGSREQLGKSIEWFGVLKTGSQMRSRERNAFGGRQKPGGFVESTGI